jgi:hypothetical protein
LPERMELHVSADAEAMVGAVARLAIRPGDDAVAPVDSDVHVRVEPIPEVYSIGMACSTQVLNGTPFPDGPDPTSPSGME